jgi:hypothetical protein
VKSNELREDKGEQLSFSLDYLWIPAFAGMTKTIDL